MFRHPVELGRQFFNFIIAVDIDPMTQIAGG